MDSLELKEILQKIKDGEPTNLRAIANNAGVDRGNLQLMMKSTKATNVRSETVEKIRIKYPKYFPKQDEETNNVLHEPAVLQTVPLDKYVSLLEDQLAYLKRSVEATLSRMEPNLELSLGNIIAGRAEIRASIEYQVMKDAKGNEKTREGLMEQINTLVQVNLSGGNVRDKQSA